MVEEHTPRPIRVVLAAPFPEIVSLHEKMAEYADRLDVCGAVMDAASAADQARVLQPDVIVVSGQLDDVDAVSERLAAISPVPPLVAVSAGAGSSVAGARTTVSADISGSELHDVIERIVAGTLTDDEAGAGHDAAGHGTPDETPADDTPTWFWQARGVPPPAQPTLPPVSPAFRVVGSGHPEPAVWAIPASDGPASDPPAAEAPADVTPQAPEEPPRAPGAEPEEVIPPKAERPTWPPPWFKRDAEEAARREADARAAEELAAAERARAEEQARADAEKAAAEAQARAEAEERARAEAEAEAEEQARVEAEEQARVEAERARADAEAPSATIEEHPAATEPGAAAAVEAAVEPVPAPPAPEAEPEPVVPVRAPLPRRSQGRAESVLVFSGKGGAGSSVVATNLAVALAQRGSSVAIVDLNLQYGDVAVMLHLEGHHLTIEALAQQGDQLDGEALEEVLATGPEGVRALLAPASPEFADLVTAVSLRAVFRELGRAFDYVVIDSASHLEELVLEAMESADRILLVTAYSIASIKDTKVTLKLLQSLGIEPDRISVVLNQTKQRVSFPRGDIEKSLSVDVLAHVPFDPRIDDSIDAGAPMTMSQPKSELSRAIIAIADTLSPPGPPTAQQDSAKRRFGLRR